MSEKLVKYLTRDYKLRDRSIIPQALLCPRFLKEIYYTEFLDVMKDGLVTVYVKPSDFKRISNELLVAIKKDSDYIEKALLEGLRVLKIMEIFLNKKNNKNARKVNALRLVGKYQKIWNQFGSFLEFTHALGRIDIDLPKFQLGKLSEFHNRRKEVFMDFFNYLGELCFSVTKNDNPITQKNLDYLTIDEIKDYFSGKLTSVEVEKIQVSRKNGYLYYVSSSDVEIITDFNSQRSNELLSKVQNEENQELRGKSVSKGLFKGEAKIINISTKLRDEDISEKVIITTMTTPEMDIFLKKVGGIVTEEGGVLCHAAIFARESGIPTITMVKNATNLIKDGDLIEVDANKGIITIL